MKIKAETILQYSAARAQANDPDGKYSGAAYELGTLASVMAHALSSPAEMERLRSELQKLQEKGDQ